MQKNVVVSVLFDLTTVAGRATILKEVSQNYPRYQAEQSKKTQAKRKITLTFSIRFKEDSFTRRAMNLASEETVFTVTERQTLRDTASIAKDVFNTQVRPEYEQRGLTEDVDAVIMRITYRL